MLGETAVQSGLHSKLLVVDKTAGAIAKRLLPNF